MPDYPKLAWEEARSGIGRGAAAGSFEVACMLLEQKRVTALARVAASTRLAPRFLQLQPVQPFGELLIDPLRLMIDVDRTVIVRQEPHLSNRIRAKLSCIGRTLF